MPNGFENVATCNGPKARPANGCSSDCDDCDLHRAGLPISSAATKPKSKPLHHRKPSGIDPPTKRRKPTNSDTQQSKFGNSEISCLSGPISGQVENGDDLMSEDDCSGRSFSTVSSNEDPTVWHEALNDHANQTTPETSFGSDRTEAVGASCSLHISKDIISYPDLNALDDAGISTDLALSEPTETSNDPLPLVLDEAVQSTFAAESRDSLKAVVQPSSQHPSLLTPIQAAQILQKSCQYYQHNESPFKQALEQAFEPANWDDQRWSFRAKYEITRVAIETNQSPRELSEKLLRRLGVSNTNTSVDHGNSINHEAYDNFWKAIRDETDSQKTLACTREAWLAAKDSFHNIGLSGSLEIHKIQRQKQVERSDDNKTSEQYPAYVANSFTFSPLKKNDFSNRVCRMFGAHRLFVLNLRYPKNSIKQCAWWLVMGKRSMFGRKWTAFFFKSDQIRQDSLCCRVYLFATEGSGIKKVSRKTLINRLVSLSLNKDQLSLKLFSRIGLALTDTREGCTFQPHQIIETSDSWSCCPRNRRLQLDHLKARGMQHEHTGVVTNDGAARISFAAAMIVQKNLKLSYLPSAFQGRCGPAKGVWMVDYQREKNPEDSKTSDMWIEVTSSQKKFVTPTSGKRGYEHNYVFEVHSYSKKVRTYRLTKTLFPILSHNGVPFENFEALLVKFAREEVSALTEALGSDDEQAIFKWVRKNTSISRDRAALIDMSVNGQFPTTVGEWLVYFLRCGLSPRNDRIVFKLIKSMAKGVLKDTMNKMHIDLPRSAHVLMIPDPLGVLEDDEVQLNFSEPLVDPNTEDLQYHLSDTDVLVARFPAYLPSDIQRVRAVFKPALEQYRDAVIFPVRTPKAPPSARCLADMLSGGDYDGDKAWVCWEPLLVKKFRNAEAPVQIEPEVFGIIRDREQVRDTLARENGKHEFILKGFEFNIRENALGTAAAYIERYNYSRGTIDGHPALGCLPGLLVDAAKQGLVWAPSDFIRYLIKEKLPRQLPQPYYKDCRETSRPTAHVLDRLHELIRKSVVHGMNALLEQFEDAVPCYQHVYAEIYVNEKEEALNLSKHTGNSSRKLILEKLEKDMKHLGDYAWRRLSRDHEERIKGAEGQFSTDRWRPRSELLRELHRKFHEIGPAEACDEISNRWAQDWTSSDTKILSTAGNWNMLKAACLYYLFYNKPYDIAWHVAGKWLGRIRADSRNSLARQLVQEDFGTATEDEEESFRSMYDDDGLVRPISPTAFSFDI